MISAQDIGGACQILGGVFEIGALVLGTFRVRRAVNSHLMTVEESVELRWGTPSWKRKIEKDIERLRVDLANETRRSDENDWRIVSLIRSVTRGPLVLAGVGVGLWMLGVCFQTWG